MKKRIFKWIAKLTGFYQYLKPIYDESEDCYAKAKAKGIEIKKDGMVTKEEKKELVKLIIDESDEIAAAVADLIIDKII